MASCARLRVHLCPLFVQSVILRTSIYQASTPPQAKSPNSPTERTTAYADPPGWGQARPGPKAAKALSMRTRFVWVYVLVSMGSSTRTFSDVGRSAEDLEGRLPNTMSELKAESKENNPE